MSDLTSLPEVTGAPWFKACQIYATFDKNNQELPQRQVIDLKALNVIGEIMYYETIFSPALTVTLTIANSSKNKIFENYALLGGEFIHFQVQDLISSGDPVPGIYFNGVLNSIDNYSSNNFVEIFRIKATSLWFSDTPASLPGTITNTPTEIMRQLLKSQFELQSSDPWEEGLFESDPSTNKVTYNIGQEKKDNVLAIGIRLAAMAQYKDSAGFFFWRNKFGFNFRSIDSIISEAKSGTQRQLGSIRYKYSYNGYNPGADQQTGPGGSSLTAIYFKLQTTDHSVKQQAKILGNTTPISFDPIRYDWFESSVSSNFGEQFKFENLSKTEFLKTGDTTFPPFGKTLDFQGMTFTNSFDCTLNDNPHKGRVVSKTRYAKLLDITALMTVPLNTSLMAGTIVEVDIKKQVPKQECSFEEDIVPSEYSGLYIIAAVCHAMDVKKGYTSLHLVRDYGKLNELK